MREALASALAARGAFDEARVLDLFAGTGALAFEALSRGASHAVLVDQDRRVAKALRVSAETLGLREETTVLCLDARRGLTQLAGPFDLVFLDPPYALATELPRVLEGLRPHLAEDCIVIIEHGGDLAHENLGLASIASYQYGDTSVELMRAARPEVSQ